MRIAYVQLGAGFPPLETQVARLQSLAPDEYHVEDNPTAHAAKRLIERLENLKAGQELCLFSLDALRCEAADAVALIAQLLHRRVVLNTFDAKENPVRIDPETGAARVLDLVAELRERQKSDESHLSARAPEAAQRLLTSEEIQEIRKLHRAGLSPRRIGLLFRRSPDCILSVLSKGRGRSTPVSAAPLRKTNLHKTA
jgi:DNA invertase Pin-like site-specific DNA recombinase